MDIDITERKRAEEALAESKNRYLRILTNNMISKNSAGSFDERAGTGVFFAIDMTEQKRTEKALANIEIARKQEIHHRIKNNLQVISSLLDLQADKFRNKKCIRDSEVLEAFRESQSRIISTVLIHEELYKGGGMIL